MNNQQPNQRRENDSPIGPNHNEKCE